MSQRAPAAVPSGRGDSARGAVVRDKILRATLDAVAERPIADVQVRQVAELVGVSVPRLLYYFPSKDILLREVFRWSEDRLAEQREVELADTDDPREQLARFVALYLPTSATDPSWKVWLDIWLRSPSDADLRELSESFDDRWGSDLEAVVQAGIETGVFRDEGAAGFADWFTSLLEGLAVHVLTGRSTRGEVLTVALDRAGIALGADLGDATALTARG